MKTSTLESKTVRPGLMRYSFYASERRPTSQAATVVKPKPSKRRYLLAVLSVLLIGGGAVYAIKPAATHTPHPSTTLKPTVTIPTKKSLAPKTTPAVAAAAPVNYCAGNILPNFIKVSISQRHMWACQGAQDVYDTPVVTGIDYLAADKTPVGTYQVYGKSTDLTLTGADSTGSWNDPVSFWMPFLNNKYGQYGFHDATWRANGDFGNISPNSANASHGCIELPLGAAQWLYNWAPNGTTVTVQS